MRETRLILKLILVILICVACNDSSKQRHKLPHISLQNETYIDSLNNLEFSLLLPKDYVIDSIEKRHLVEVAYSNFDSCCVSLLDVALNNYINSKTILEVLYITPNFISAKVKTNNWVEGGDTLSSYSYLTYMRGTKSKLMLDNIISTADDIEELMEMIKENSDDKSEYFSPDVDITVLGEYLVFHYDRHKQQSIEVSVPINEVINKFDKFKKIYNE